MTQTSIAHVKLYSTSGYPELRIFYTRTKNIHVYYSPTHVKQNLLQDFITALHMHKTEEFEASNSLSRDIVQMFLSIIHHSNKTFQSMHMNQAEQFFQYIGSLFENPTNINHNTTLNAINMLNNLVENESEHKPVNESERKSVNSQIPPLVRSVLRHTSMSQVRPFGRSPYIESNDGETEPPPLFLSNEGKLREVHEIKGSGTTNSEMTNSEMTTGNPVLPSHPILLSNEQRIVLSNDNLKNIARNICDKVRNNHIKPPNFNNKTRSGYRKIKNFIHNATKLWLSKSEIDILVRYIQQSL